MGNDPGAGQRTAGIAMSSKYRDLTLAVGLCFLAGIIYRAAQAIPPSLLDSRFGSGLLPSAIAIVLACLSIAMAIGAFMREPRHGGEEEKVVNGILAPVVLTGLLAGYIAILQAGLIGFVPLTTVFLFASMMVMQDITWRSVIISAIGSLLAAALARFLFVEIFSVYLP